MTNSFDNGIKVTKYKMTVLQIAFFFSVNIYVRETKRKNGKVNRKKKLQHRNVTKKKVRHTKNDSTKGAGGGGRREK